MPDDGLLPIRQVDGLQEQLTELQGRGLDDLTDVDTSGFQNGSIIRYAGDAWYAVPLPEPDLSQAGMFRGTWNPTPDEIAWSFDFSSGLGQFTGDGVRTAMSSAVGSGKPPYSWADQGAYGSANGSKIFATLDTNGIPELLGRTLTRWKVWHGRYHNTPFFYDHTISWDLLVNNAVVWTESKGVNQTSPATTYPWVQYVSDAPPSGLIQFRLRQSGSTNYPATLHWAFSGIEIYAVPEDWTGYMSGHMVVHEGTIYESTADDNLSEPGTVGAFWTALPVGGDPLVDYGTALELAPVDADTEAAGVLDMVARADHKHTVSTAAPVALTGSTQEPGVAVELARADHQHGIPTGIPQANVDGLDATLAAKADLVGGLVPTSQIPAVATTTTVTVANEAARLALTTAQVQPGDLVIQSDGPTRYILGEPDPSLASSWLLIDTPSDVVSVNGQTGTVVLGATDVGASPSGHTHTPAEIGAAPAGHSHPVEDTTLVGEIKMWPVATPPAGYLVCGGGSFSSDTYPALAALLGDTYGVHSGTTYYLPNFSYRSPMHHPTPGTAGGDSTEHISLSNLPQHTHSMEHIHDISHGHTASAATDTHSHTMAHSHTASSAGETTGHTHSMQGHTHSGSTAGETTDHTHVAGTLTAASPGEHRHGVPRKGNVGTGTGYAQGNNNSVANDDTGLGGDHTHTITGSTGARSAAHSHTFATGGPSTGSTGDRSAAHAHAITVNDSGPVASGGDTHGHTITVTSSTADTGASSQSVTGPVGLGLPINTQSPFLGVTFIIKAA